MCPVSLFFSQVEAEDLSMSAAAQDESPPTDGFAQIVNEPTNNETCVIVSTTDAQSRLYDESCVDPIIDLRKDLLTESDTCVPLSDIDGLLKTEYLSVEQEVTVQGAGEGSTDDSPSYTTLQAVASVDTLELIDNQEYSHSNMAPINSWLVPPEENALLALSQSVPFSSTYTFQRSAEGDLDLSTCYANEEYRQPAINSNAPFYPAENRRVWMTEQYPTHSFHERIHAPGTSKSPGHQFAVGQFDNGAFHQQVTNRCWRPPSRPKSQYEKGFFLSYVR